MPAVLPRYCKYLLDIMPSEAQPQVAGLETVELRPRQRRIMPSTRGYAEPRILSPCPFTLCVPANSESAQVSPMFEAAPLGKARKISRSIESSEAPGR